MQNKLYIHELIMIVKSVENNKKLYNKNYISDISVITRCENFCKKFNINITHGSAYNELRHKYYYYIDKYIKNLLENRTDLYNLRANHIISDKEIIDRLLRKD